MPKDINYVVPVKVSLHGKLIRKEEKIFLQDKSGKKTILCTFKKKTPLKKSLFFDNSMVIAFGDLAYTRGNEPFLNVDHIQKTIV